MGSANRRADLQPRIEGRTFGETKDICGDSEDLVRTTAGDQYCGGSRSGGPQKQVWESAAFGASAASALEQRRDLPKEIRSSEFWVFCSGSLTRTKLRTQNSELRNPMRTLLARH